MTRSHAADGDIWLPNHLALEEKGNVCVKRLWQDKSLSQAGSVAEAERGTAWPLGLMALTASFRAGISPEPLGEMLPPRSARWMEPNHERKSPIAVPRRVCLCNVQVAVPATASWQPARLDASAGYKSRARCPGAHLQRLTPLGLGGFSEQMFWALLVVAGHA